MIRGVAIHGKRSAVRPIGALVACLFAVFLLTLSGSAAPHRARLSLDLLAHEARHTRAAARVIVDGTPGDIDALASRHHLRVLRYLAHGAVLEANSAELTALAADPTVDHLSGDAPVRPGMFVSPASTGADQVRAGSSGLFGLGAIPGVTGKGIGVAVIDSGVSLHPALKNNVVARVSVISGDSDVDDEFGHGTHVAGIIAGSGGPAARITPLYTGGIAPDAKIVSIRVLGADGVGLTSDVIAGIDWAIAHRSTFNLRVINLSLGHPVTEPAETDPLCAAVQRAVAAGLVVVASAGNAGKAEDGSMILGGITSPGNSPYAITVGAVNHWGTVPRNDDTLTTYSSRGPARYDLAVKPDVAAPGNKIVSLEASQSYLASTYGFLHVAGPPSNAYMRLSGTSMAAPMVSGAAALLLQGQPSLGPAQIKIAIQAGATYMPDAGLMGAGAGSADFWASRKIAANGLVALPQVLIGGLVTSPSGAVFWDAGTLSSRLYGGIGVRLLSFLEAPLVWADPSRLGLGDLNLFGLLNPLALVPPNPLLWGQVAGWSSGSQILWGDTIYDPQGQQILWGDSRTTDDNQILWGDSVLTSRDPQ
ncbi:MAG: S8 family serine peptidase [Betaproteobacteria bacterium]